MSRSKKRLSPEAQEAEEARIAEGAKEIQRETDEIRLGALNSVLQKLRDEGLIKSETSDTQDYVLGLAQAHKLNDERGLCW
jgi:hypothetical protein